MNCAEPYVGHVPPKLIDELISAGWEVLAGEFTETAYADWKQKAHDCLKALLGPDHYYTVSLDTRVTKARETNMLAAREFSPRRGIWFSRTGSWLLPTEVTDMLHPVPGL